jgi:hypothetical protein
MVSQRDAMERLNHEKDYEDRLVELLAEFYISCLEDIDDIETHKKAKIKEILTEIKTDSVRHSELFGMLVQMVLENGEQEY